MDDFQTNPAVPCPVCAVIAHSDDAFCNNCGYPLKGSEMEQKTFIIRRDNSAIDLDVHDKKIKRATATLMWVGIFTAVYGVIMYFLPANSGIKNALLLVNLILGLIYYCLSIWSKHKPMAAIITGFSLYVLVLILNMIDDPLTIAKGIIIKIVIIGAFVNGIKSVIEAEKIKKELNFE